MFILITLPSAQGREPLHLRNDPEDLLQPHTQRGKYCIDITMWSSSNHFLGLPKPKKIVPGSSEAARQTMIYSEGKRQLQVPEGSNTSKQVPQGGRKAPQEAPQGRIRGPRPTRWDSPLRGQAEDEELQASDHLRVPSLAPSSPSPQSQQPLQPLSTANYQPMTQRPSPLPAVNRVPGVNAAHQTQYPIDPRTGNTMYTYPPPHPYPAHSESHEQGTGPFCAPAPRQDRTYPGYRNLGPHRDDSHYPDLNLPYSSSPAPSEDGYMSGPPRY